jgi:hypothetical protein
MSFFPLDPRFSPNCSLMTCTAPRQLQTNNALDEKIMITRLGAYPADLNIALYNATYIIAMELQLRSR